MAAADANALLRVFSLLGAWAALSCGQSEKALADGSGANGGGNHGDLSLSFRPPTTLTTSPRAEEPLTIAVTPAGDHLVRLALLSGETEGSPADASLSSGETRTDPSTGIGRVTLVAPSSPITFGVRAWIDEGPSTTLSVSVSASGFADLEVRPDYTGTRVVERWTATARAGVTCDDLLGTPPPDGDLLASADYPDVPIVEGVPVGRVLAVTARAGHYIGGCTTVAEVTEGERNRVVVPVADRAIQLDQTRLGVEFGLDSVSTAWSKEIARVRADMLQRLFDGEELEASAVLDAMNEVVPDANRQEFAAARATRGWDSALQGTYAEAGSLLRDSVTLWLDQGELALYAPDAIRAELEADEEDPGRALLSLLDVAGHEPAAAGLAPTAPASWSADSHDTVLIGSNLLWAPEELLGALAEGEALEAVTNASSMGHALGTKLNCSLFAGTLVNSGEPQGQSYSSCGLSCTIDACRDALQFMWERARSSEMDERLLFSLSASGAARVGGQAEILELTGTWVGRFSSDTPAATASGPFLGTNLE